MSHHKSLTVDMSGTEVKPAFIKTLPDWYIVETPEKKFKAKTLRGCFIAANGRPPASKDEMRKFLELCAREGILRRNKS